MKSILIVTFITILGVHQVYTASCHWREIDLCIATMALFGQGSGLIADTEESVESLCGYIKEAHDCIGNYSHSCISPPMRELGGLFIEGTIAFTKEFCTKGSEIQQHWLKHAPCLSENFDSARPCFDHVLVALEVLTATPPEDRLGALCCTFSKVRNCMSAATEQHCGKEAVELIDIILTNLVSELPIVMCSSFDPKSDRCVSVLPPPGTKSAGEQSDSAIVRIISAYLGD